MEPSVTLSARTHTKASSQRKLVAGLHTANTSTQVQSEPASSEVISNLITSLSNMSTFSTQLPNHSQRSPSVSARAGSNSISFRNLSGLGDTRSSSYTSEQKDYDIRKHSPIFLSSLDETTDRLTRSSHADRAAKSTYVLSGLSTLEFSHLNSTAMKNVHNDESRPASKESNATGRKSTSNLNIVPIQTSPESRGKLSNSWSKRQQRIIYKSSIEKLRNRETERKNSTADFVDEPPSTESVYVISDKTSSHKLEFTNSSQKKNSTGIPTAVHLSGLSTDNLTKNFAPTLVFTQTKDQEPRLNNKLREQETYMSEEPHYRQKFRSSISLSPPRTAGNSRQSHTGRVSIDEQSSSTGSIDERVEAFLCAPRLSQKIRHPQTGRVISFSEVGDREGFAVFCCIGMGLTRYVAAFYDELALTLKLRLITPDRPGVGDSEPYNDGTTTPLSWPDDVYTICQFLKITKFSILAHSAGAIYALATALRMPQHIRGRIHLLAPWIPPSQMSGIGGRIGLPPNNSIPTSQRILRVLPTTLLKAANSSFISAKSNSLKSSLPRQRKSKRKSVQREVIAASARNTITSGIEKGIFSRNSLIFLEPSNVTINHTDDAHLNSEAEILAAAAYSLAEKERQVNFQSRLTHAIWNLATQGANPAVDLLVCLERRHTIGFRYVDITRAVVIHHGTKDTRVPLENVLWMGKIMKRCDVRVLEGEGHSLMASASVMSGILTEIAREWEDWIKVKTTTTGHRNEGIRKTLMERASIGAFR